MTTEQTSEIRARLKEIVLDVERYFESIKEIVKDEYDSFISGSLPNDYWDQLTPEMQSTALKLVERLLPLCASIADLARSSTLTGSEDITDVKRAAKSMRAALRLRIYSYYPADVIHDEGSVLGFQPAKQNEDHAALPIEAKKSFLVSHTNIEAVLKLIEAAMSEASVPEVSALVEPNKYRTDTAFVMMWMDPKNPDLADVVDTVQSVFKAFGIRAQRADDIEHEGLITERVINEIRTSEFLFADLTGMRPNVYYEVGYAHALGKRVILFRKTGTGLHFDLSGYNCPEYENLRDLRNKLNKRLINITNRKPSEE